MRPIMLRFHPGIARPSASGMLSGRSRLHSVPTAVRWLRSPLCCLLLHAARLLLLLIHCLHLCFISSSLHHHCTVTTLHRHHSAPSPLCTVITLHRHHSVPSS